MGNVAFAREAGEKATLITITIFVGVDDNRKERKN